jgi:thiamine-phosphate pyrophosphorylase
MSENIDAIYPCRLYLISPPRIDLPEFTKALTEALSAGDVGAFQLRLKDVVDAEILRAGEVLLPICRKHGVAFIVNDRPDLALKLGADGVHLGQEDSSLSDARALLGDDAVIGVTCHASAHMAMEAGDAGADYVAFGAFFPTTSKPMEKQEQYGRPEPQLLEWWSTYTVVPSVAIGGLTPENCGPLVAAGADFVAVITAVWNYAQGPAAAVLAFNRAISEALKLRQAVEG